MGYGIMTTRQDLGGIAPNTPTRGSPPRPDMQNHIHGSAGEKIGMINPAKQALVFAKTMVQG